jgi:hypothetical protein
MLVKVLKTFPYAPDVRTHLVLAAGDVVDIDASVVEGLHAEGFIEEATDDELEAAQTGAVVMQPPVEIPDDWAGLHWFKLKALAERIAGGPVANKVAAVGIVQAAVDARA